MHVSTEHFYYLKNKFSMTYDVLYTVNISEVERQNINSY